MTRSAAVPGLIGISVTARRQIDIITQVLIYQQCTGPGDGPFHRVTDTTTIGNSPSIGYVEILQPAT